MTAVINTETIRHMSRDELLEALEFGDETNESDDELRDLYWSVLCSGADK